ncbi:YheC/YheD family protein, partial [Paenisporosarcina sp.]|uniref:YheC/YheD family protein n=1 Tax=Paenisporosarcina sp. TaxID=1932001 RepID=UPI003C7108EE
VKNQTGQWEDVGIIARKGSKGSIVTNLSNGGRVDNVIKLMSASFKISEEQVLCILEEMSIISIKAARVIDKYENIFRLGVDIAIDCQQHIYLLELNHRCPAYKNSFPKVAVTKINNSRLDYAKYLAGFPINI